MSGLNTSQQSILAHVYSLRRTHGERGEGATYNIGVDLHLAPGAVRDESACEQVVAACIADHPRLATCLKEDAQLLPLSEKVPEIRAAEAADEEEEDLLVRQAKDAPFPLTADQPLVRFLFVRRMASARSSPAPGTAEASAGPPFTRLVVVFHHLVADGYSLSKLICPTLMRHLNAAAAAAAAGKGALPGPNSETDGVFPPADKTRAPSVSPESIRYWMEHLPSETVAPLDFPLLEGPLPASTGNGIGFDHAQHAIGASLWSEVREAHRKHGVTNFTWMFGAMWAVWSQYTGRTDFGVGAAFAGRAPTDMAATDSFAKVFPLYPHLAASASTTSSTPASIGDMSWAALLQHVQAMIKSAKQHEHVSATDLAGERPFVAQISLAVTDELEATSAAVTRANIFSSGSPSDLAVYLRFSRRGTPAESVAVQYVWRGDVLSHEVIAQFHDNWLAFMAGACAVVHLPPQQAPATTTATDTVPANSWRRINWLSPVQRHQVLHLNNPAYEDGLAANLATDAERFTLHGMFRKSAREHPDCIAVVESETRQATYAQLDRASHAFAQQYLAQVAPQERVVLLMARSLLTMQAMLAIMKRGAIYVPVDPGLPIARVHYIIQQARASLVVCNTSTHALNEQVRGLLAGAAIQICELPDEPYVAEEDFHPDFPVSMATGASAYIIFTSGTTGVPKGVEILHRAACNSIRYHDTIAPHTERDAVLQSASLSFDMSIGQAFNAWRCGARLVLLMEVGEWHNTVVRHGVTIVQGPASVIASAFDADCMPACLRQVQVGGEPVALTLLHRMINANPHIQFANLYGPTEASMYTNMTRVRLEDTYVPMGPPITNQRAYVLNDLLQLLPAGVPGRIFMGALSPGVGYFGREDLTREKFVPDPFACEFPSLPDVAPVMYDSGDIARWKTGGNLECLGRRDQQVKWHGLRIELGEIESHLMTCPDLPIKASAARLCPLTATSVSSANNAPQPREAGGETHVLVGYVVPQRGNEKPIDDAAKARLLQWLGQNVPKYMVPSIILVIDELPMSANGKLARERLPIPPPPPSPSAATDGSAASGPSSSEAPPVTMSFHMSSHEQKLWKAWNGALDLPVSASQVDSREAMQALNFFDQSGTSLSVMRLLRLVRAEFPGCTVSVADIYRKPRFGDLLSLLRARHHRRVSSIDIGSITARNSSLKKVAAQAEASQKSAIAIVGMAGVFPGAKDVGAFWDLICNGEIATRKLSAERGDACGRLSTDMFEFDAGAFGLKPDEATLMDPQHRLALQQTLHALEDARIDTTGLVKGVFVSGSDSGYWNHIVQPYLATGSNGADQMRTYTARINNGVDQMASRIAYHFNCTGPTAAVQTACSSSLSCLSVAVDALQLGRCDVAIVTAASLRMPGHDGYVFQPGMIFSEAGQCRPFEARSDGTVPGNAVVSLILVRQELAERLRAPRIYAAIDAVAFGNNGRDATRGHATFSTPTIQGQVQVLTRALREAKIYERRAELVHYVETHGTGTAVGDAVEWAALQNVLGKKPVPAPTAAGSRGTPNSSMTPLDTVYVGGVKANIGHTDAASGLVGLVKCALVLFHSHIPVQPDFQRMHENLDSEGRLVVPTKAHPILGDGDGGLFQTDDAYACVQSIGMGGTNASAILHRIRRLMVLSSGGGGEHGDGTWYRSPIVFFRVRTKEQAHAFVAHLRQRHRSHLTQDVELRIWARESMERYLTAAHPIVAPSSASSSPTYLRCVLTRDPTTPLLVQESVSSASVLDRVILFGGQGAFEWGKLRGAFYAFRPARETMRLSFKWFNFLSAEQACKPPRFLDMLEEDDGTLQQQPQQPSPEELEKWSPVLNFILQCGMWQLWAPHVEHSAAAAMSGQTTALGHSLGEVMAAYVAGHLTWREGIQILYHRITLFDEFGQQGKGRMAVVRASADETRALLAGAGATDIHVACYNTPTQTVVCGPRAAIESLQVSHPRQVRLVPNVGVAYHMPEASFGEEMKRAWHERWLIASRSKRVRVDEEQAAEGAQGAAKIVFASCIDDTNATGDLRSAAYWWKHLTQPVQYIEAVQRIARTGTSHRIVSLEVGLDSIASRLWAENVNSGKTASAETMAPSQVFLHLPRVQVGASTGTATATPTFALDASTMCEQLHVAFGRAWIAGLDLDREACLQLSAPNKHDEHRFAAPLPLSAWSAQRMLAGAAEDPDVALPNTNAKAQQANTDVAAPRVVWTSEMRRQAIRDAFRGTMVFAKQSGSTNAVAASEPYDAWLDLDVFEQGNDSLQVVTLIHRLTQLDLDVRTQHIYEHPTVRAFETWALEQVGTNRNQAEAPTFSLMMTPSASAAVVTAAAADNAPPTATNGHATTDEEAAAPDTVVLLPTGGGTLHIYMSILDELKRLGCRARIIGLHRPDAFIPSVRALASYYVDRMVEAVGGGKGRVFLVGGSYGGMLAFEMASQLGRARTGAGAGSLGNCKTALAERLAVASRLCGLSMFDTPSIRTHRFERTDLAAMVFWVLQNKYQLAEEDLAHLPTVEAIKTYVMVTRGCVKSEEEWRECLRFGQFFYEDIHNILTYDIAEAEKRDPSRELPPQRLFIACREPLPFDAHDTWTDWRGALGPEARASEPAPGHHLSMYKDEGARAIARELLGMLAALDAK